MYNMAGKSALLLTCSTELFVTILVSCGVGSSQVVPDGLVYTKLEKTLVQGVNGILTCRFYKDPHAVYWKNGPKPDDQSLLTWYDGTVSGPRYDDGSYDIDVNSYSLIIKNVSKADTGRFYCIVSNYQGILIRNHTDIYVVDTAMKTKSQLTLQMRPKLPGILQCTVHIRPRTVTWIKKDTMSSSNETLATLESNGSSVSRSGAGYDRGICNITKDYSLIINDIQVQDEGLYVCAVTDFDTGITFHADTLVNVTAQPLEPFPSIRECLQDPSDPGYCSLPINASEITLTCYVTEYYPDINLQFLHGSKEFDKLLITRERNNTDGTKSKSIQIAASASKDLYTCVAFNIPGISGNSSTSVLVYDEVKFNSIVLIIVVILLVFVIVIFSVACSILRRRRIRRQNTNSTKYSSVNQSESTDEKIQAVSRIHCKRLIGVIAPSDEDRLTTVHAENKTVLFDIEQMSKEWQLEQRTNYSTSRHIIQEDTLRMEMTDYAWPTDEEIKWISGHFNKSSLQKVCNKLKIKCTASEKEMGFERLREWRNKKTTSSIIEKHKQLNSALTSSGLEGLLPHRRGLLMYKVEVIDVAFELLLQDLLPLTKTLGMSKTKLVSYRRPFIPSHLTESNGTIGLLLEVLKKASAQENERDYVCTVIEGLHYRKVTINRMIGYEMSYGELCAISTAAKAFEELSTDDKRGVQECGTERHDDANAHSDPNTQEATVCSNTSTGLDLLKDILHLTDDDMASPNINTGYALLKCWKEMPRLEIFNYRAALAQGLRDVKLNSLADEVISGKYVNGQTSCHFIQDLLERMDEPQRKTLVELLKLHGHDEGNKFWSKSSDGAHAPACQVIVDWVANWTKKMKGFKVTDHIPLRKETAKRHRDFNNILLEHGFLELAREIMILEQQID